jgi:hypothetical protein
MVRARDAFGEARMVVHSQTRDASSAAESPGGSSKTTKVLSLRRVHRTDAVEIQVIT